MKKLALLVVLLFSFSIFSFGSHIPGGTLTYQCTGTPNQYLLTMKLFVKCPSTLGASQTFGFTISNTCGLVNPVMPTMNLIATGQVDVTQTCSSQTSNCPPNNGGVQGVLMYTYTGVITFPAACNSWQICFDLCCRDQSSNMNGGQGNTMTFCSTINSATQPCGGSPVVTGSPIPFVCNGQTVNYCLGATDPDGDSLYYSMIAPSNAGVPMTAIPPLTIQAPLAGFVLNQQTGCMTFNQPTIGNFVVAILIQSYNAAGVLTGAVVHDFQIVVTACSNIPPTPPVGGVVIQPGGGAFSTGPNSIELCEGASACFDMTFTDANLTNTLTVNANTTNVAANLPGAIMTTTGTNPLTVTICWTVPIGSPSQINLTVSVLDGACPIQGSASQPLILTIITSTIASEDTIICGNQSAQLFADGGNIFNWAAISGPPIVVGTNFSCNPCATPVATPTATTTYEVTSNLTAGCTNKDTVTVFVVPDFTSNVIQSLTTSCLIEPIQLNANVTPTSPNYTYSWTPSNFLNNTAIPNPVASITVPGNHTYDVTVTNPDGCVKMGSINITTAPAIAPVISILTPDSTIACDSSVLVDLNLGGGIPVTNGPSLSTACPSPPTQITLGTQTGANTNTSFPAPFSHTFKNTKHQFLFTAAELNAMGFIGGKITEWAFQVTQVNGQTVYPNFKISMKATTITNLTTWQTGLTQVFNPANYPISVGWNNFVFNTAYEWDGNSNLVVEVCYALVISTPFTQNSITPWTTTTFTSSIWYMSDNIQACTSNIVTGTSNKRPLSRLTWCPTIPDPTGFTYEWTPNFGINDTTIQNPILSPNLPTTYVVTVTNILGGCIDTDTISISVQCCKKPLPTVKNVTCFGGFDGEIIVSPVFVVGSEVQTITYSNSITGAILQITPNVSSGSDTIMGLSAGTYTISIEDTNGCTRDTVVQITQPNQMIINSITQNDTICINGNIEIAATAIGGSGFLTLSWTDSSTVSPMPGNGPHMVNPIISPTCYSVFATDTNNCVSDTQVVCVSLYPELTASTTADKDTVCEGFGTNLDISVIGGSGTYNYDWYDNNVLIGNGSVINVVPTSNPTLYVGVASDDCTTPSDTILYEVYWYDVPTLTFERNKPDSCNPITIEFVNTSLPSNLVGATLWQFSDGAALIGDTVLNKFSGTNCRDLTLTVTTVNGCILDSTVLNYVCPKGYPTADFDANPEETTFFFPEISFQNQSTPSTVTSLWTFNSGLDPDTSTLRNPTFAFLEGQPGNYNVWLTVTNEFGCVDSTMKTILVKDIFLFYIPNSFTPNGDDVNDVFRATGEGIDLSNFKMYIFDRWGKKIFETDNIEIGWDGTYEGTPVQNGLYVWKVETKEKFVNKRHEMVGHINVLR